MKRLGYRKSRKGCLRCKQRRVKCDENVPCSACSRHGVPCSLESLSAAHTHLPGGNNPRALAGERHPSSVSSPSERGKEHSSPSPTSGLFTYFAHVQYGSPGNSDDQAWILDIELMHHYTAKAHRALYTPCNHNTEVLQADIPREGLAHPFLLHQILAFSALHLAHLNPNSRHKYLIQASQHQDVAITTMNSMLAKPLDPDECHALYGTSIFVAISAFATFPSCDKYNLFQPVESLIDIFILIHGMHVLLRSSEENIRGGPLGRLMQGCGCQSRSAPKYLTIMMPRLKDVLSRLDERTVDIDQDKRETITAALSDLIESIEKATSNDRIASTPEQRVIFGWPMRFPSAYLGLLRCKDSLAMVILSYYCVLMRSCEEKCWYFEGWSNVLMKPVVASVTGTPWESLIQWPVETIDGMAKTSDEQEITRE